MVAVVGYDGNGVMGCWSAGISLASLVQLHQVSVEAGRACEVVLGEMGILGFNKIRNGVEVGGVIARIAKEEPMEISLRFEGEWCRFRLPGEGCQRF